MAANRKATPKGRKNTVVSRAHGGWRPGSGSEPKHPSGAARPLAIRLHPDWWAACDADKIRRFVGGRIGRTSSGRASRTEVVREALGFGLRVLIGRTYADAAELRKLGTELIMDADAMTKSKDEQQA